GIAVLPAGTTSPTVPEVASLHERPSTAAVGVDPSNDKLLAADVEGVPFPNWRGEFGWRQAGTRTDRLEGRTAQTVFYRHDGKRLALPEGSRARVPGPPRPHLNPPHRGA